MRLPSEAMKRELETAELSESEKTGILRVLEIYSLMEAEYGGLPENSKDFFEQRLNPLAVSLLFPVQGARCTPPRFLPFERFLQPVITDTGRSVVDEFFRTGDLNLIPPMKPLIATEDLLNRLRSAMETTPPPRDFENIWCPPMDEVLKNPVVVRPGPQGLVEIETLIPPTEHSPIVDEVITQARARIENGWKKPEDKEGPSND